LFDIVFRPTNKPPSLPSINQPPKPHKKERERAKEREGFIKVVDQEEKEGINIEEKGRPPLAKSRAEERRLRLRREVIKGLVVRFPSEGWFG